MFPHIKFFCIVAVTLLIAAACQVATATSETTTTGITAANEFSNSATTSEYFLTFWDLYSSAKPSQVYKNVETPATVLAALVQKGEYPGIFNGVTLKNILDERFVPAWIYEKKKFSLSAQDQKACSADPTLCSIRLCLDGINYNASVKLNNKLIADRDVTVGALRRFEFDVTSDFNIAGENDLSISVLRQGHVNRTTWRNPSIDLSIDFLDWAPSPPDGSMGLWRHVRVLVVRSKGPASRPLVRLDGFVVHSLISSTGTTSGSSSLVARLNVSFAVKNVDKTKTINKHDFTFSVDLGKLVKYPTDTTPRTTVTKQIPFTLKPNEEKRIWLDWVHLPQLVLDNDPPIWWPFQMNPNKNGKQFLFNASVGILETDDTDKNKKKQVHVEYARWRFGIRQSENRFTQGGALQLYINNVPLLVRGGGYAPDLLMRMDRARLIKELTMHRAIGLNVIRLEGMMMTTEFFDMCDELGLLVTPGIPCCDAWQNWGEWVFPTTYDIARASVQTQARRLSWHPSVAFFFESSDDLPPWNVEAMYTQALQDEGWPNGIVSSAEGWVSNLTGNSGVKMSGCYSWLPPSYWLIDDNPLQYLHGSGGMNFGGAFGFITENSIGANPMTFNSWNRTVQADANMLWGPKGSENEAYTFHCGMPYGHFANLTRHNEAQFPRFGGSTNARDYLFKAQLVSYEGVRAMFEAYSRNHHINATGVIQWQSNSPFPRHLWTLYDYYHQAHGGFFGGKLGCGQSSSGLHVMMSPVDGSTTLLLSNFFDFPSSVTVTVEAAVYDINGKRLWNATETVHSIPADAVVSLDKIRVPLNKSAAALPGIGDDGVFLVRLSWSSSNLDFLNTGQDVNWYFMTPKMDYMSENDWWTNQFYYTPVSYYANMQQFNSLKAAKGNLQVDVSPIAFDSVSNNNNDDNTFGFRDPGARYYFTSGFQSPSTSSAGGIGGAGGVILQVTLSNKQQTADPTKNCVAFFIQIRIVDKRTNFDVTPTFYEDNFFSLLPGETRIVRAEIPLFSKEVASGVTSESHIKNYIRVEVDTYNDIVAQKQMTGVVADVSTTPINPAAQVTTPSPSNNNNNNNKPSNAPSSSSDNNMVSKGEYVTAVVFACLTSLIALVATYFAFTYRRQAQNGGSPGDYRAPIEESGNAQL